MRLVSLYDLEGGAFGLSVFGLMYILLYIPTGLNVCNTVVYTRELQGIVNMTTRARWICLNCGKTVYYPSVDEETRNVICTHCRKPELVEVPAEQLAAMGLA